MTLTLNPDPIKPNPKSCTFNHFWWAFGTMPSKLPHRERESSIDNLLVRIPVIIVTIRLSGLASWNSLFQVALHLPS